MYADDTLELNSKSCEMLAEDLIHEVVKSYPGRAMVVEVSEDGINGARLEYTVE